ncbi:MAG: SAM-dependent chlorinase/fluorinase [Phycisphaerales bacterium]|nr:MAG: SAM-dependent chlorinase/fluorinase [Phycisphaerales bacterium]
MERRSMCIVTLITDYGTRDYYVGALKGVILGIAPDVKIVDITHDIEPHNVVHGAFVLRQVWPWYPPRTIHVVVVDPGVGSDRRIIVGQYAGRLVVAPDNGIVTFLHHDLPAEGVYSVEDRRFTLPCVSETFHGRDVMAPVVGHLAAGVAMREFGPEVDAPELLDVEYLPRIEANVIHGSILHVDRFGTLVTNIRREQIEAVVGRGRTPEVLVNDVLLGPIHAAFCDVRPGESLAMIGSSGLLEIAVNQGNAVERFGHSGVISVVVR